MIKVEHAVNLFKEKMIEERTTPRGAKQLAVRKSENPETKKNSGYLTDFSWDMWNMAAEEYMESIKSLDQKRILEILNCAFAVPDYVGRQRRRQAASRGETSHSARAALHSDVETDGEIGDGTEHPKANGSGDSGTSQAHVGGATVNDDVDVDSEARKVKRRRKSSRGARNN